LARSAQGSEPLLSSSKPASCNAQLCDDLQRTVKERARSSEVSKAP
jgi:hypothetical protein